MQLLISTSSPALIVSYDRLTNSISANFSLPDPEHPSQREQEAMHLISEKFAELSDQLVNQAINASFFANLRATLRQVLRLAFNVTGADFELVENNLQYKPVCHCYC
jgi:hypothetical protein